LPDEPESFSPSFADGVQAGASRKGADAPEEPETDYRPLAELAVETPRDEATFPAAAATVIATVSTVPAVSVAPVATDVPAPATIPAPSVSPDLPARDRGVVATERKTDALQPKADDKGEVIWSADLTISSGEAPLPREFAAAVDEASKPAAPGPVKKAEAVETKSADHGSADDSRSSGEGRQEPVVTAARTQPRTDVRQEFQKEETRVPERNTRPVSKVEQVDRPMAVAAPAPMAAVEPKAAVEAGPMAAPVEEVAPVTIEPPTPLRPTQVASVQVDIPAPAGMEDAPPMRLTVVQRGEQVSVKLRSWDSTTTPLEPEQMQPLLHSLAERGYVSGADGAERIAEGPVERPLAAAEANGGNNDQQPFQNANDRQQQQQDRQQQQQHQFLLRRQARQRTEETFVLPPPAEVSNSPLSKGIRR